VSPEEPNSEADIKEKNEMLDFSCCVFWLKVVLGTTSSSAFLISQVTRQPKSIRHAQSSNQRLTAA
jgi:hypothetical protein